MHETMPPTVPQSPNGGSPVPESPPGGAFYLVSSHCALKIRHRFLTALSIPSIMRLLRHPRRFALGTRGALFPRSPDGNLGVGLFAIAAGRLLRRLELLDDVPDSTATLA